MQTQLHRFFYHSVLASGHDASCVSAIIRTSRVFNAANAITGVLVFDGECFCQYIEGPQSGVHALVRRLERDPRHSNFTPLVDEPLPGARLYDQWSMAYCQVDGEPFITTLLQREPHEAIVQLHASGQALDLG